MNMGDGVDVRVTSASASSSSSPAGTTDRPIAVGASPNPHDAPAPIVPDQSAIRTLEDVEEILALVDEFSISDLRIADGDVVVEVSRLGGRGFVDGVLAKRPHGVSAATDHVVEQVDASLGRPAVPEPRVFEEDTLDDEIEAHRKKREQDKENEERERRKSDLDTIYESDFIVTSNRVGFFFSGAKNKPPLVMVGDHVDFNQPVCIIEQLAQQYVYLSEASGTVIKIFVEDGDAVEFAQHIMVIRPD